ncbi:MULTISPECIES: PLD nuclease N-terminal domain-containing protein [Actinotignum]|uniref:PLD nuclease N-terminal domain-containing protein n=1 Tax=Actinotignum TaxID=1653174 RepID=UPI00254E6C3A|nr:PLD nuclease N-terminal domain-containing protein [Actinotignum schaalii]MDE1536346.1 PLD nuclease N-terminal domain-containing protein [Actinotignum schaalii]MDK7271792.1 PLD nuclease N-terminal domain-containing protein [Actinotignum schaalii]
MARVIMALLAVSIWIYGIIDVIRTDTTRMPGRLRKPAWLALTVLVPVLGSLLWIAFSFPVKFPQQNISLGSFGRGRSSSQRRRRPVAPDDDPDFLSRLDAENRFREWERQQKENDAAPDAASDSPSAGESKKPGSPEAGGAQPDNPEESEGRPASQPPAQD